MIDINTTSFGDKKSSTFVSIEAFFSCPKSIIYEALGHFPFPLAILTMRLIHLDYVKINQLNL
jgi:hypothetical protein